jgi:hypothetical protein
VLQTPLAQIAKNVLHVLELEVGFVEYIANTLLYSFEECNIICSARTNCIQPVVDAIE